MTILRPEAAALAKAFFDLSLTSDEMRRPLETGLLRALDLVPEPPEHQGDFVASVTAGYVETDPDAWAARLAGGAL